MKSLAIFCSVFFLFACKSKYKTIDGEWTSNESPYLLGGMSDKLTFFKKDSFKIEIFEKGQLKGTRNGSYVLNAKEKLLTVKFDDIENTSEILEFTDTTIISKPLKSTTVTKLRRLK